MPRKTQGGDNLGDEQVLEANRQKCGDDGAGSYWWTVVVTC